MKADPRFTNQPKAFWAHVRSISQQVGYTKPGNGYLAVPPGLPVPQNFRKHGGPRKSAVLAISLAQAVSALENLGLSTDHMATKRGAATRFGRLLCDYFAFRAQVLNGHVRKQLMDAQEASKLFAACKAKYKPRRPFVMNKQKGEKRAEAYLTCMVNMIVEHFTEGYLCNFDPLELTTITQDGKPLRTLARRVDGAFPSPVNPIAIWEIKEYYYTTTFGSRIADGVYETLLDGMEIEEFQEEMAIKVRHYLFADSFFTWWGCGKPYLCRIVDMLHMGYADEVLFGKEVVKELPRIIKEWIRLAQSKGASK